MQHSLSVTKGTVRIFGERRRLSDVLFRGLTLFFVLVVIMIIIGVTWVLVSGSLPTIQKFGFSFLTNQAFDPVHNVFGVAPAIYGTLVTSAFALIFAIPLGVGAAIFLVDFCPRPLRIPVAFIAELLAAVPSIIYGMWGFLLLAPWLQHTGEPWLQRYLGFLPFFQGPYHGLGILAPGLFIFPLLEAGLIIFIITVITNVLARLLIARMGRLGRVSQVHTKGTVA